MQTSSLPLASGSDLASCKSCAGTYQPTRQCRNQDTRTRCKKCFCRGSKHKQLANRPKFNTFHSITQEAYTVSFELDKAHSDDDEFNIGVTDAGLCYINNGEDMRSTFAETTRMTELWESLDKRQSISPQYIKGSGRIYEKTFWLDIGDR